MSEKKRYGVEVNYIVDAESVGGEEGETLDSLLWALYLEYERDMKLMLPYRDNPPAAGGTMEIPAKIIESSVTFSEFVIEQSWRKMNVPENAILTVANKMPAVWVPPNNLMPVPLQGPPVQTADGIYEKKELSFWKGF